MRTAVCGPPAVPSSVIMTAEQRRAAGTQQIWLTRSPASPCVRPCPSLTCSLSLPMGSTSRWQYPRMAASPDTTARHHTHTHTHTHRQSDSAHSVSISAFSSPASPCVPFNSTLTLASAMDDEVALSSAMMKGENRSWCLIRYPVITAAAHKKHVVV